MPRIVHTLLRAPDTEALPNLCQAKKCLNSAQAGAPFCPGCMESFGYTPEMFRKAKPRDARTRQLSAHRKLVNSVRQYAAECTTIYMVQMGDAGPIKIGKTNDLRSRVEALQTGNPCKLKVIATLHAPAVLEMQLHAYLDEFRLEGEWFSPSKEVIEIAALMNESLDAILVLFEQRLAATIQRLRRHVPP